MRHSPLYAFALGLISALALPPLYFVPALWLAVPGMLWLVGQRRELAAGRLGSASTLASVTTLSGSTGSPSRSFSKRESGGSCLSRRRAWRSSWPCSSWCRALRPGRQRRACRSSWSSQAPGALADFVRQFVVTGFPWNPWGADWAIPGPIGTIFLQPAAWIRSGPYHPDVDRKRIAGSRPARCGGLAGAPFTLGWRRSTAPLHPAAAPPAASAAAGRHHTGQCRDGAGSGSGRRRDALPPLP